MVPWRALGNRLASGRFGRLAQTSEVTPGLTSLLSGIVATACGNRRHRENVNLSGHRLPLPKLPARPLFSNLPSRLPACGGGSDGVLFGACWTGHNARLWNDCQERSAAHGFSKARAYRCGRCSRTLKAGPVSRNSWRGSPV